MFRLYELKLHAKRVQRDVELASNTMLRHYCYWRWRYTDRVKLLIKKFWHLNFNELQALSSNPAALVIDKLLFIHKVLRFRHCEMMGWKGHCQGWCIWCSPVNMYIKQWLCTLYAFSVFSSRMTLWIQISKLQNIIYNTKTVSHDCKPPPINEREWDSHKINPKWPECIHTVNL